MALMLSTEKRKKLHKNYNIYLAGLYFSVILSFTLIAGLIAAVTLEIYSAFSFIDKFSHSSILMLCLVWTTCFLCCNILSVKFYKNNKNCHTELKCAEQENEYLCSEKNVEENKSEKVTEASSEQASEANCIKSTSQALDLDTDSENDQGQESEDGYSADTENAPGRRLLYTHINCKQKKLKSCKVYE